MNWVSVYEEFKPACNDLMDAERFGMLFGWGFLVLMVVFVTSAFYVTIKKGTFVKANLLALLPVFIVLGGMVYMHDESLGEPYVIEGRVVEKRVGGRATKYTRVEVSWAKELTPTGLGKDVPTASGDEGFRTEEALWDLMKVGDQGFFVLTPTDTVFNFFTPLDSEAPREETSNEPGKAEPVHEDGSQAANATQGSAESGD